MRGNRLRAIGVVVGLSIVLALPTIVQADVVWSEDFDGGPGPEWTLFGPLTFANDKCRGYGPSNFGLHRPSNLSVGSWSFDIQYLAEWQDPMAPQMRIFFMCSGNMDLIQFSSYYCLKISKIATATGDKFKYNLVKGNPSPEESLESRECAEEVSLLGALHHVMITRNEMGHLSVLINGSVFMQVTDTEVTTSEHLFITSGLDCAIDNILLDDTPPGIPLEWVAIIVGGAAVVIIVVVVILRRR